MNKDGLIYVVPVEGRAVRDYRTKMPVPPEGMLVPVGDAHWMASINFGDLIEGELPTEPKPAAEEHEEHEERSDDSEYEPPAAPAVEPTV